MWERETFFDRHPDPMWVCDPVTFEFFDVNTAALAAYGYGRDEFLALRATELWPPEDVPEFLEALHRLNRNGTCRPGTFRHRRSSGEILHVEITMSPVEWQSRAPNLCARAM